MQHDNVYNKNVLPEDGAVAKRIVSQSLKRYFVLDGMKIDKYSPETCSSKSPKEESIT